MVATLAAAPAAVADDLKVAFQLSEGDKQARIALLMAKRDLERDPKAKIEIVAYGDGVSFLQNDTLFSSQGPEVAELTNFLPKVQIVPSGSLEIAVGESGVGQVAG